MDKQPVGVIAQLTRYPVKSFAGEELEASEVAAYGLYGDRSHAFIDDTKEGWDRYVTARQIPGMLAYKARLVGAGSAVDFPELQVTSPDGREFGWDERLLADLQRHARTKLSLLAFKPSGADLLAVDDGSILIVTDAALRRMERAWGKRLDPRRFRANVVISLTNPDIDERAWIGKRLTVGGARLKVVSACERCSMITIDPESLERDASLLRTVNEEADLQFGVYASVERTGPIRVGDPVSITD